MLSRGRNLGFLGWEDRSQEMESLWKDRLKTICGWMSSANSLENPSKENEAPQSLGLWKLLAEWKPSDWSLWFISSDNQRECWERISSWERCDATNLSSKLHTQFVCLFGEKLSRNEESEVQDLGVPQPYFHTRQATTRCPSADLRIAPFWVTSVGFPSTILSKERD